MDAVSPLASAEPLAGKDGAGSTISVVVPAYNEQDVLVAFHERTTGVLRGLGVAYEIVYVNDGSTDETIAVMRTLRQRDTHVTIVDLSRNFGKEIAMTAGLDLARGDAAIVIDADLQDPPELIPQLVAGWREGFEVVYAVRASRGGDRWLKKTTAHLFHRALGAMSRVTIPADTGDFRLLSRRAIDALHQLREQHRYMKGLFAWIGFPQKAVTYHREPRAAGKTKWTYWSLWNFALEGVTSFTVLPLKLASYLGLVVSSMSFAYAAYFVYKTLRYGNPVAGYPSLLVIVLFLGGVQLLAIGVLGEYLGRMFNEVKRRPLYVVNTVDSSELASTRSDRGR